MNTKTGAATAIGIPRDSYVPIPGCRQRPGQRGAVLRRPAAARRDRRRPDRDPARVRLRHPLQDVPGDDQRHRRHRRQQPGGVQRPLPQGRRASRRARSSSAATPRWPSRGSASPCIGGDFDRSANQQRVLRGIQAKVREKAGSAASSRAACSARWRTWQTDASPGRALPARARRHARCEPRKITDLRGAGRHRQRRAAPAWCCPTSTRPARYGDDARDDATLESC